jgi:hypothetical protein
MNIRLRSEYVLAYRKERIENAMLFFAENHYKKTNRYIYQTFLYKYLAFFEFRHLRRYGTMPLELRYSAMERGPVPLDIYANRDKPDFFSTVAFERTNDAARIVKPRGKFNPDYFSKNELEELDNLIEMFAQKWVKASTMSDASHRDIKAWRKTYKNAPNAVIDPIDEFDRDIENVKEEDLTSAEEIFLMRRKLPGPAY